MKKIKQTSARLLERLKPLRAALWRRRWLWLLVLVVAAAYSALSVLRHRHFESSAYDLGIFDQAVWQYSQFRAPLDSVRSNLLTENLLGDHFHPVLALLAPLFWIYDNVEALLVAQAALFALAIVPIFLFTEKRLGKWAAYLFSVSYAIYWGVQKAVEFDFHEIAIAVPLIALAIYLIDEKRWAAYFVCIFLLLMTKENLSLLVLFFGVYLIIIKEYRRGLISAGAGVVWFFVATKVLIPLLIEPLSTLVDRPNNYYRYWSYNQFGSGPFGALKTILTNPWMVVRTLFSPGAKLQTYWYTFYPFLFLSFVSPLFVLAVPLLAERFLSEVESRWVMDFHYTATFVPILVMASADGLHRLARLLKREHARYLVPAASCLILAPNLQLLPRFPLWNLTSTEFRSLKQSDRVGQTAVSLIPAGASVLAQGPITPHLSHRRAIFVLNPLVILPDCDFIITSDRINPFPAPAYADIQSYLDRQLTRGYRKVFEEEGWVILKREAQATTPLPVYNNAAFVEQRVPETMLAGQSYEAHITMRNTGYNSWTSKHQYRLALLTKSEDWGLLRVELPGTVEPDATVTFDFRVTAPRAPGVYSFRWGMIQDGVQVFGEQAPEVLVNVTINPPG
jgi:uncharacterized membrane protein